jgi:hypothetical protein
MYPHFWAFVSVTGYLYLYIDISLSSSGPEIVSEIWIFHTKCMILVGELQGLYLRMITQHRQKAMYTLASKRIQ